jgi:plastocyanin
MRPLLALTLMAGLASLAGTAACSDDNNGNTPAADVSITSGASTKTTTAFSPNPFTRSLASGGTVVWVNNDGTVHDLEDDTALWDSGDLSRNETFSFKYTAPGTYTYHCSIHPGMVGTVVINP